MHTFADYIKNSQLKVGKNISNDVEAVRLVIDSLGVLLSIERQILNDASEINDEGTNAVMSDFISEQEKTIWMLKAWME